MILTTPRTIGPMVKALVASIGSAQPIWIDVDPQPGCRVGECFPDVTALVEREGGSLISGWCIWERRLAWAEAEHHAIWQRPDDQLIDPMPKPDGETTILFVPDPEAIWTPGDNGLPTRRRPNKLNKDAIGWVKCADAADALIRPFRAPGYFSIPTHILRQQSDLGRQQMIYEGRLRAKGL